MEEGDGCTVKTMEEEEEEEKKEKKWLERRRWSRVAAWWCFIR